MKRHGPTTHEIHCRDHADHFVAVRGRRPADRVRRTCATLDEARAYASGFGDGRTMIYAVTPTGHAAHIGNA